MLKRPSARRTSHQEGIELNLVPILDAMVTLIGFLLFTTSFFSIVAIETQMPMASSEEVQEKLKEKPLQLTITFKESEVEIWSPFNKVPAKSIPNGKDGPDVKAIHESLLEIKKKFPKETSIVLMPTKKSPYDQLISVMDTVQTIEKTDTPIFIKNEKTGMDEQAKLLFPKVVFGNLLGDS